HLLEKLLVQELFPPDLQLACGLDVIRDLVQYAEREGRDLVRGVPHVQNDVAVWRAGEVLSEKLAGRVELDELCAVVDLVGKTVRRLVDIDGPDEAQVGRQRDSLIAEFDLGSAAARADLHRREEPR